MVVGISVYFAQTSLTLPDSVYLSMHLPASSCLSEFLGMITWCSTIHLFGFGFLLLCLIVLYLHLCKSLPEVQIYKRSKVVHYNLFERELSQLPEILKLYFLVSSQVSLMMRPLQNLIGISPDFPPCIYLGGHETTCRLSFLIYYPTDESLFRLLYTPTLVCLALERLHI